MKARLLLWTQTPGTPVLKRYDNVETLHVDLVHLRDRDGWIEVERGDGKPAFEQCVHASAVVMYRTEVF